MMPLKEAMVIPMYDTKNKGKLSCRIYTFLFNFESCLICGPIYQWMPTHCRGHQLVLLGKVRYVIFFLVPADWLEKRQGTSPFGFG